jgi:hypothetical protein
MASSLGCASWTRPTDASREFAVLAIQYCVAFGDAVVLESVSLEHTVNGVAERVGIGSNDATTVIGTGPSWLVNKHGTVSMRGTRPSWKSRCNAASDCWPRSMAPIQRFLCCCM